MTRIRNAGGYIEYGRVNGAYILNENYFDVI